MALSKVTTLRSFLKELQCFDRACLSGVDGWLSRSGSDTSRQNFHAKNRQMFFFFLLNNVETFIIVVPDVPNGSRLKAIVRK